MFECYTLLTRKCPLCNHQSQALLCFFPAFHDRRLPSTTSLTLVFMSARRLCTNQCHFEWYNFVFVKVKL
jgi:hypothetical protein